MLRGSLGSKNERPAVIRIAPKWGHPIGPGVSGTKRSHFPKPIIVQFGNAFVFYLSISCRPQEQFSYHAVIRGGALKIYPIVVDLFKYFGDQKTPAFIAPFLRFHAFRKKFR